MKFKTVGTKGSPAVVMINGSFTTDKGLIDIAEAISDQYYVILPIYDGHYEDGGEFTTREDQAEKIINYLNEEEIKHIKLIQGLSMGAEIALTLASKIKDTDIEVDRFLFDGGPFFYFPKIFRNLMFLKFKSLVHSAQESTGEDLIEKFSQNKMINWMIDGDLSPYKNFLQGLAEAAPHMTDGSIQNETDACYTFDFPVFTEEEQRKYYFTWSKNEPAFKSALNVRKNYPNARYGSPGDLGHCGFMCRKPEKYVNFILRLLTEDISAETTDTTNEQVTGGKEVEESDT